MGNNFGRANALREELTPMLVFVALFASAGAFTFGFDNGWWGGVLGHVYFNEVFGTLTTTDATTGVVTHSLTASQQSAGTALGTAGIAIGCMIAGFIANVFGRKKSFYAVAIGSILGVLIQITSGINGGRYWQLVAGKIVVCCSIGVASVSVPLYLSEVSPAPIRGALVNSYVWVQSVGGLFAYVTIYCLQGSRGPLVWCLPIGLQLFAPVAILLFGWSLPESPRWLIEKGRREEAHAALMHLRRGKVGYNPQEDLILLEEAAARERELASTVSWAQCFRGTDGFRTFIVAGVQCLQQGQGISFMSNYLVVFFLQLGISNVWMILVVVYVIIVFLTIGGFFVQDFFGRRFLLVGGGAVMAGALIAVAGITTVTPSPTGARANACVALIFLWLAAFSQSWTSIPWTVSAELPSEALRDKTLAIGAFGGYAVGTIIGLVNPYMQNAEYGNLGGKVGFVYGTVSILAIVFCYIWVPELKGRSLEEVDWMFAHGVPVRKMATYKMDQGSGPASNAGDKDAGDGERLEFA
ncbi:general substrate transporter [Leucosporidium creatinivorum]|uniref:General substrate transporter n=1 Tax=Leucosporidium creatinivorum TaxID=106004 RepID=A0A1Y2DP84_9BASI|nr:general substrate transporter [Leucosporidium creatinivorum]